MVCKELNVLAFECTLIINGEGTLCNVHSGFKGYLVFLLLYLGSGTALARATPWPFCFHSLVLRFSCVLMKCISPPFPHFALDLKSSLVLLNFLLMMAGGGGGNGGGKNAWLFNILVWAFDT